MPNCLALGTWSPSFVSFLEENIHRRKSVGRKSYRVSKNKCSLAQWSRGAYQLQVRLFGTQNKEPIFCFFLKENIQRRKSSGCKRYRVSKKNKITDASKNYIYGKADILSIHLSLWLALDAELHCLAHGSHNFPYLKYKGNFVINKQIKNQKL